MKAPGALDGFVRVATRLLLWALLLGAASLVSCFLLVATGWLPERDMKPSRAKGDIANLHLALRTYRAKTGTWPPEATWSEALVAREILERDPTDPWDRPYVYRLVSIDGGAPMPVVTSVGRDGTAGTDDDVGP